MATEAGAAKGKKGGKRGHPSSTSSAAAAPPSMSTTTTNSTASSPSSPVPLAALNETKAAIDVEEPETSPPPEKKPRRSAATAAAAAVAAAAVAEQNDMKDFQVPKSSRSSTRSQALQRGRAFSRANVPPINVPKPVTSPSAPAPAQSQKSETNNKQPGDEWNTDELSKLIENLIHTLPKADSVKYSTQVERIDWSKVCFDSHTAEECKDKWGSIMTKLRRYRTLTELVMDAKEWVKHPWMTYNNAKGKPKHPDFPKKPLTPYFRYFLEKREKYSQENPDLSMTELAKLLAKKFAELPEKKKQKYKECYEKENGVYKSQLEKFKEEHPDMYPDVEMRVRQTNKQNGPQKPQTPVQLFIADKMNKQLDVAGSNRKELEEKYKSQWRNLTDPKRVRWIKKAMADEQRYAAEIAEYCILHPDYKPDQIKNTISKAEKGIKDRSDGKPERPPNSGYSLYSKIMLKELKDIPSKEKMGEISRRWKELPDKDRQSYARQATEAMERYQQEYKLYVSNLSEEDRKKLEEENKKKKKPAGGMPSAAVGGANAYAGKQNADHTETAPSRPKKPMSALFFYQQEKLAQYKLKNPEKSEQELTRLIAREYGELSEKKKEKYKKMAEEAKKSYEQNATSKENEVKNKAFKGEPKKPPQSGYSLFTSEHMSKLTDIEPKYRMAEISKRWGALLNNDKEKYKRRATEQQKKYSKELQKFLLTLTEEERKVYQQMKAKKPIRRKPAASKVKAEQASSSSSEESSKEENKDESSSSESGSGSSGSSSEAEESDSDSESGSESESKSEASGSGKDSDDDAEDAKEENKNGSGNNNNSSSDDSDSQSESGSASESESEEEEE